MKIEAFSVETSDGCRLALTRFSGRGGKPAVLLCHGFGSNRHCFDFAPDASLARHLAEAGRDAWCLELRGYGKSDGNPAASFEDFIEKDLPAAIGFVAERSSGRPPHFVGHSMGGIVLLAYLSSGGSGLLSGIAIGSSLDYSASDSGFKAITPLRPLSKVLRKLPLRALSMLWRPLAGRFPNKIDEFALWTPNADAARYRDFMRYGIEDPSIAVAVQLISLFEPGGLRSADGSKRYFEGLAGVRLPVMIAAGDKDRQCPPDAAASTLAALGSTDKKLVSFGKAHGQPEHYGHMDLVVGRRASREVYPVLSGWLDRHDPSI
jgi:pimeloyl-ACP methyl ester carboxylesterase